MSENPFNIGDTVRLKSGGPLMTVASIAGHNCTCTWFNESHRVIRDIFNYQLLKEDKENP